MACRASDHHYHVSRKHQGLAGWAEGLPGWLVSWLLFHKCREMVDVKCELFLPLVFFKILGASLLAGDQIANKIDGSILNTRLG